MQLKLVLIKYARWYIMANGFIVEIISLVLNALKSVNIVEYFKRLFVWICKHRFQGDEKKYANIAIDIFIIFKWCFVVWCIKHMINAQIVRIICIYLLFFNVYTYYYYHVWTNFDSDRIQRTIIEKRRRQLSLFLSFAFVILSYSYFYIVGFNSHFVVQNTIYPNIISGVYHSFASTFTGGSSFLKPSTSIGLGIQASQIFITFIYLTVLLSKE
jgi:hypothetical protein